MSGPKGLLAKVEAVQGGSDPQGVFLSPLGIGSLLQPIFLPSVGNNGKQLEKTATNPTPHLFFCPVSEKSQDSYNFAEANRGLRQ